MDEWSPFRKFAPGRKTGAFSWPDLLVIALLFCGAVWLWSAAAKLPEYDWQWTLLIDFIVSRSKDGSLQPGLLLSGLFTTLRIGFWTFLFSLAVGALVGVFSCSRSLFARFFCPIYVNLIRDTPPLVILFVVYFFAGNLLPVAPLEDMVRQASPAARQFIAAVFAAPGQMDRMIAAILALGFYQSAFVCEIVRGGMESVPKGQWDAAKALGFGPLATIRLVILPQAARSMLPPLTGQCISTFKESALASLISLPDLTFQSLEVMAVSRMTFEIWVSAAALYLFTGFVCACAGRWLERKYSAHLY